MAENPIQDARQVAYRALCLGALLKRHSVETAMLSLNDLPPEIQDGWRREHEGIHQHLKKWVLEEKILGYFSSDERQLWDANLGKWQQLDRAKIYWRCESLGMLLWAMEVVEAPYYDTQFDLETLLLPLDLMSPTIDFVWMASLRDADVIHQARDLAQQWHWRAQAQTQGLDVETIKKVANEMYTAGNLPEIIEDDFPALSKSYAKLDNEELTQVSSIAKERHYALNWLCKQSGDWDDVPTQID